MPSPDVKLLKLQHKYEKERQTAELLKTIVNNPVVEIVAAYVIIEYLQKEKYVGEIAGTIAEGGVLTAVGLQQLAPALPSLASAGEGIIKMIPGV